MKTRYMVFVINSRDISYIPISFEVESNIGETMDKYDNIKDVLVVFLKKRKIQFVDIKFFHNKDEFDDFRRSFVPRATSRG
jgi:hypothetical protein